MDLKCSPELAKRLRLRPANVMWRNEINTCYEVEDGCISVSTGYGVFMWPIIGDDVKDGIDHPTNGTGSRT